MERNKGREYILQAAAKVFADKGYEGARVDEIAKVAGVTKSLLYYHFKSKEDMFDVLVEQLLTEYQKLILQAKEQCVDYESDSLKGRMQTKYFPFGIQNEDLIRCAFIESLKRENACKVFFQMVELQQDDADQETMKKLILEYFFNILPCVVFLCQKEAWSEHFHMDMEQLGELFLEQYDQVHGRYHRGGTK
ncbi:MAG: TetR/AcrR family transcriptional regulator [Clostridia bacterium]|nr:TetR/AcrR family transcriptional regulator [Clostridia bacterium]